MKGDTYLRPPLENSMSGTPTPEHNGFGGRGAPVLIPIVTLLVVDALALVRS